MPEIENWDSMVVVTARHGEKFLGWVNPDEKDPKAYVEKCVVANRPVELHQARILVSQLRAQEGPDGNAMVGNILFLMPIDMFSGAIEKCPVMASSWYFPSDSPDCRKSIVGLLENARQMEVRRAAVEHGISIVGPGTKLPPPPTGRRH